MNFKQLLTSLALLVFISYQTSAQTDVNKAQAVFIYNFLSHVKWPDNTINDKYIIGIYGKTATSNQLKEYISSRTVNGKKILIKDLNTKEEANDCHVLLVANNKSKEMADITNLLSNKSCLIIGEQSGTVTQGAVVDFRVAEGKLRYKLDQANATSHNLFISRALQSMSL